MIKRWPLHVMATRRKRRQTRHQEVKRQAKTQQKISGWLTSEEVTQDRLDIRSYIDTTRKHGVNVMTALPPGRHQPPLATWRPALTIPT
ncbi:MAG TPA: hypothetical protein VFO16_05720 [Pseudonocardiaceae bacterium]|nr:hypothetical protein [Pseudonocardiaceae bacterium]